MANGLGDTLPDVLPGEDAEAQVNADGDVPVEAGDVGGEVPNLGDELPGGLPGEDLEAPPVPGDDTTDPPVGGVSLDDALEFTFGKPSHSQFTIGERDVYFVPVSAKRASDGLFVELAARSYVGTFRFDETEAAAAWTARAGQAVLAVRLGTAPLDQFVAGTCPVSLTVEHPEGQRITQSVGSIRILEGE